MKKFSNKVALITGGSRGIGRGISRKLASEGCSLAINYLSDHESAENLVKELANTGVKISAIKAHIGDPESRRELWENFDWSRSILLLRVHLKIWIMKYCFINS